MKLKVTVNGQEYLIDVEVDQEPDDRLAPIVIGGNGPTPTAPTTASVQADSSNAVVAPLSGSVSKILVAEGEAFKAGQVLVVLEAMKMETEITAPADGTVTRVIVKVGDTVAGGKALVAYN